MKVTIYRYSHPTEFGKWLYTGQTTNLKGRDARHRKGNEGFGRRFKKLFPGLELPQPDFREVEVNDHIEANIEETIAIFVNRTWRGQGGMNLTLPGSTNYARVASLGGLSIPHEVCVLNGQRMGPINGKISGPRNGRRAVESGQLSRARAKDLRTTEERIQNLNRVRNLPQSVKARNDTGKALGKRNVETGRIHILGREQGRKNVESGWIQALGRSNRNNGIKTSHDRWHVKRNISNPNCKLCIAAKQAA